ncbi:Septum formation initiator [Ammonifex degensii KC4]|uniref:Septum formation initiator n=1 Tax=Ammonifex degensii (strain DSM 10501 / KC4) TaxID=429009 RepID=C9RA13_AMMDK|nr:septum formation initiator family protein [Ammonifex degensii]ACX53142.1 Septum formation initiator [Ammonifex degensii KC4]
MKKPTAKKAKKRRFNYGRLPTLLFVIFLVYLLVVTGGQIRQLRVMEQSLARAEQELNTLKERNNELWEKIKLLQSDSYLEQLARQRLGMIKAGETPVVVEPPPQQDKNTP